MDFLENPNYYDVERPYKSKYICVKCRKVFKRPLLSDFNTEVDIEDKGPVCTDCGSATSWIGPKFRAPKINNLNAWNSIRVLNDIGALNFQGFASNKIQIPESTKSLIRMLEEMKAGCLTAMNRWATMEYHENNKHQIKYLSESVKKIDEHLKQL